MTEVALRPVEEADLEIFYEHQADPGAADMAKFPSRDRAAHFEHWTRRVLPNPSNLARTVLVDGVVAGNVVCWPDPELGHLFGYWIGREFWGRGVATTAVAIFLNDFSERPIHAFVALDNIGSKRVLEKSGFIRTDDAPHTGDDGVTELLFVLNR